MKVKSHLSLSISVLPRQVHPPDDQSKRQDLLLSRHSGVSDLVIGIFRRNTKLLFFANALFLSVQNDVNHELNHRSASTLAEDLNSPRLPRCLYPSYFLLIAFPSPVLQ